MAPPSERKSLRATTGSSTKTGVEGLREAIYWCMPRPQDETLQDLYPDLPTEDERWKAWVNDNHLRIREAATTYLTLRAYQFPPDVCLDPSGSLFQRSEEFFFHLRIYWTPTTIAYKHEGSSYTISNPHHVAALHAIRDWPTALAYLQEHHDSSAGSKPLVLTVPSLWHPDVFPGEKHPDAPAGAAHNPAVFPTMGDIKQGEGKVRYTLYGWRKRHAIMGGYDWRARQHYYAEHYDLMEILDVEENVTFYELGKDSL